MLPQMGISTSLSDATLWQAGVPIGIVTPADKSVNMMAASWNEEDINYELRISNYEFVRYA